MLLFLALSKITDTISIKIGMLTSIKQKIIYTYNQLLYFISPKTRIVYPKGDPDLAAKLEDYNKDRPYGTQKLICYVAQNNLLFSRSGKVMACSYNQSYVFGKYPKQSINEIISGEKRKKFIEAHNRNNLSLGCNYCRDFIVSGKYHSLKAVNYDIYSKRKNNLHPAVIEFDISSYCNLRCIMCNEKNREVEAQNNIYNDKFIEEITPLLKHIKEAKFYGGEPFVIKQYYKIWDIIVNENPQTKIFVITNGTHLNERIKNLLNKGNFEISVSIDSLNKEKFEKIRKGANFENVMQNLDWFINYSKRKKRNLSVSMTIFRENWQDIPDIIKFCNKNDISVFFSYLYMPKKLSLWTLPNEDKLKIKEYLTGFSFENDSTIKQYNQKCYNEIIEHLDYWTQEFNQQEELSKRLKNYLIENENSDKIETQLETDEIIKNITKLICDAGYDEYLDEIFNELKNIDADSLSVFYEIYSKMPKETLVGELETWVKSLTLQ
ncbi:MAG: radical SAM protein [Bacteroidales bacterium]|nr:radical SAM protein [Bacteroidales bacterium]MDD4236096.1 radical SAM protein [Bacteroidales bacterium]